MNVIRLGALQTGTSRPISTLFEFFFFLLSVTGLCNNSQTFLCIYTLSIYQKIYLYYPLMIRIFTEPLTLIIWDILLPIWQASQFAFKY